MQYIQACENDKTDNRCNGPVGGEKSVFTRKTLKVRTTENAHIHELGYYVSGALLRKNQIFSFLHVGLSQLLVNGVVGGERFWSSESRAKLA